ncbi:MAG: DevR family CRISPR-associated autoregulator [Anaerolineae bacterium]
MTNAIYSLSICARATLDMHSLNNEGGEGNQIQTRMVNIVTQDGRLANVNAISGDMLKHIQAEHLFRLLSGRADVPLCAACREFNANRISADADYEEAINGKTDAEATDELLHRCALDDMEGNLITAGNRSLPRKSVVEFGWVVGLPDVTTTDSYFHVKYASERSEGRRQEEEGEERRRANLGQAIFHRPASSGVYAIVGSFELARIGFNDITQTYAVDDDQRQRRYQALLESVLYTLIEPRGAMRNTQNPHILNVEGVIAESHGPTPAPTISPLAETYDQDIEKIVAALEPLRPGMVRTRRFASLAEFADHMRDMIQNGAPFRLTYA